MSDCIFCKIVAGDIPAAIVYRDADVTAFRDIHPAAPVHVLVVPNQHVDSIRDVRALAPSILPAMFRAANHVAQQEGVGESGYRLLLNYGPDAALTVPHLHLHVLGGRPLGPMVMAMSTSAAR